GGSTDAARQDRPAGRRRAGRGVPGIPRFRLDHRRNPLHLRGDALIAWDRASTREQERTMATLMQDTAHGRRAMSSRVEAVGRELARYGLVVVVGWIGLMKFTAYEAEGIRLYVANSPLMSWVYGPLSVRGFSALLGVIEVAVAILIALRPL